MDFVAPNFLWFAVPALAVLLLARLYRSRRRVVVVGSLLLWQRIAATPLRARPRRFPLDASFLLQALVLMAIVLALAGPLGTRASGPQHTVLLVLDNGPLSRAHRDARMGGLDKSELFDEVRNVALDIIKEAPRGTRFVIARTAPSLSLIAAGTGESPAATIDKIASALSTPTAADIRAFALSGLRALGNPDRAADAIVLSLQSEPCPSIGPRVSGGSGTTLWLCVAPVSGRLENVAITAAGSFEVRGKGRRVLVRVVNLGIKNQSCEVTLYRMDEAGTHSENELGKRDLSLKRGQEEAATFTIPDSETRPLEVVCRQKDGMHALDDDRLVRFYPRVSHAPRIRMHGSSPVLEHLFVRALDAVIVDTAEDNGSDLDVFAGKVPEELPFDSKAALFMAPPRGYRSYFDIGNAALTRPVVLPEGSGPLVEGFAPAGNDFHIATASEILETGDFETLLRDQSTGRALALRFSDERARPVFVLAFNSGDGKSERPLTPPLAAFLIRIVKESVHTGAPYDVPRAAEAESKLGEPLSKDWWRDPKLRVGGVLDTAASSIVLGESEPVRNRAIIDTVLKHGSASAEHNYSWAGWIAVAALGLVCVELLIARET